MNYLCALFITLSCTSFNANASDWLRYIFSPFLSAQQKQRLQHDQLYKHYHHLKTVPHATYSFAPSVFKNASADERKKLYDKQAEIAAQLEKNTTYQALPNEPIKNYLTNLAKQYAYEIQIFAAVSRLNEVANGSKEEKNALRNFSYFNDFSEKLAELSIKLETDYHASCAPNISGHIDDSILKAGIDARFRQYYFDWLKNNRPN